MKLITGGLLLVFVFMSGIIVGFAQTKAPLVGVDHLVRVEMVQKLGQAAQEACKGLTITQNYVQAQKETTEAIEFAYPGWTLDWSTLRLVEKKK